MEAMRGLDSAAVPAVERGYEAERCTCLLCSVTRRH